MKMEKIYILFYKGVKIVQRPDRLYSVQRFNDPDAGDIMFPRLASACIYIDGHLQPDSEFGGIVERLQDIARNLGKICDDMSRETPV